VLAVTRPYEGLVFCLPVASVILTWMLWPRIGTFRRMMVWVVFPTAVVLVLLAIFLAHYNERVSGNALLMPYKLNQQTYAVVPLFIWQPLRSDTPVYGNPEMRNYYLGWEVSEYRNTIALGFARMTWIKFERYWWFYFGPILTVPLVVLPCMLRDRRIRFLLIVTALTIIGLELEVWSHPHYAAPLTCSFLAIVLQGMRHMQFWRWRNWPIGGAIAWAVVLGCFAFDAAWISAMAVHVRDARLYMAGGQQRAMIERQLEQTAGNHLVLVHYPPSHPVFREWVYNRADLEQAKVVWARDLGRACDEQLIRRFTGRSVWVVEPDTEPTEVQPYSASVLSAGADARCPGPSDQ